MGPTLKVAAPARPSLAPRDWIILPLISLGTLLLLCGLSEIACRLIWTEHPAEDGCLSIHAGVWREHQPNCTAVGKNAEGPVVTYHYNECGYRGTDGCGVKEPGTLRFVILGTSFAGGLYIPAPELFTSRIAAPLGQILGHKIEFENLGDDGPRLPREVEMIPEIQNLRADAIFLLILPYDLREFDGAAPLAASPTAPSERFLTRLQVDFRESSRALYMAEHFMLEDRNFIARTFISYGDPNDISRLPTSWINEKRLEGLDHLIRQFTAQCKRSHIPLFLVPFPNLTGATLIGMDVHDATVDGTVFPRRVAEIARQEGAQCIDATPELRKFADPPTLYYPANGHPAAAAHLILARAVLRYFRANGLNTAGETEGAR